VVGSRVTGAERIGPGARGVTCAEPLMLAERNRRTPTAGRSRTMKRKSADPAKKKEDVIRSNASMQGEGNYTAGRRYDEAQQEFVKTGQVDDAARQSAPRSPDERADMQKSEEEGLRRARK
jgi:hypothetical protein